MTGLLIFFLLLREVETAKLDIGNSIEGQLRPLLYVFLPPSKNYTVTYTQKLLFQCVIQILRIQGNSHPN